MFQKIRPISVAKRKLKTKKDIEALKKINDYLKDNEVKVARILEGAFEKERDSLSYKDIKAAIIRGDITSKELDKISVIYSKAISEKLLPLILETISVGAKSPSIIKDEYNIDIASKGIINWLNTRGSNLITAITNDQKEAITSLLHNKLIENHTVDELARFIRPCIGLNKPQTKAVNKYCNSIIANIKENNPKLSGSKIREKALIKTTRYASNLHRERAFMIARTELSFAYNYGADLGVREAISKGYIKDKVVKKWCTADNETTCPICQDLDGTIVGLDDDFNVPFNLKFTGQHMLPPAHPRCACCIMYDFL